MRSGTLLVLVCLLSGCTRAHYRQSADCEAYPIIAERVVDPAYDVGGTELQPQPASRLYDPFNPDRPPKPPDDAAAALFMAYPGGMRGARGWCKDGCTDGIESDCWELALAPDEKGVVHLDQQRAVEVALLNSREYQTTLENLYLSALGLTLNRFEFDLQWFGRNRTTFTHFGTGGAPTETNTLTSFTDVGFSRNFAAGGQLLATFANSLVYEFTGAGSQQVRSNIIINLIQPLLRGAGRKVRLENLTQAERNVLYNVRDFARFRKQFWADIAIQNGGYLDLLLAVQTVRNSQANLKQQEQTYRLYSELFEGGRASAVERDQFFQGVQSARLSVIQAETALQNALDAFKLRLGIPPRVPIELDDSLLDTFVLVDEELEKLRDELDRFQRERLSELEEPPAASALREHYDWLHQIADRIPAAIERTSGDLDRWHEQLARPRGAVSPEQLEQAQRTFDSLSLQLPELAAGLKAAKTLLDENKAAVTEERRLPAWEALVTDGQDLIALLDAVIAIQTQAKIHLIELPEVNLQPEEALAFAKENRLDLQNQLAQVTDAWRKVTVAANALKGELNIVAGANIGTDPDHLKPFNFAAEASQYSLGVEIDSPLNRVAERNVYRASLIEYQRARRDFMGLSDQVEFQIRRDLRQLELLRLSFEISRQQLLSAARQLENARIILLGPRDRRSANDTTTLNLLQALSSLLSARNALAANYINYEQQRVQINLDLEALQLDQQGFPSNDSFRLTGSAASGTGGLHPVDGEPIPARSDPGIRIEPDAGPESHADTLPSP